MVYARIVAVTITSRIWGGECSERKAKGKGDLTSRSIRVPIPHVPK